MILLVGASVRALMESAVESGSQVTGLDFFGDVDTRLLGETKDLVRDFGLQPSIRVLLEVAKSISCEGLVYGSGPENSPEGLAYWEDQGLLLGNGAAVLTKVRNPWLLCQCLEQIGVKMPQFCSVEQWKQDKNKKQWLLKPMHRGGGNGIVELPRKKEAVEALLSSLENSDKYIIEEFIKGIPASATFLANGREAVLLGTSRQLIGEERLAKPFRYVGNIVPLAVPELQVLAQELEKVIQHLTASFGLRGVNTLDFIINTEGIWVLELNPRWSGSVELIENYLGERLFVRHLMACRGQEFICQELFDGKQIRGLQPTYWGKILVYAEYPFTVKKCGEKEVRFLYKNGVRDIPRAGTRIAKGSPICTVLTEASSDRDCERRLQAKSEWALSFLGQVNRRSFAEQII